MKKILVSSRAEDDLDAIWLYIAKRSGSLDKADEVVTSITGHFALLASTPEAGRCREDIAEGLRAFPAPPYIIYYRNDVENLVISRIIHGRRDQGTAFR